MNVELINKVIEALKDEANSVGFDMKEYYDPCNSTACIAGHAVIIAKGIEALKIYYDGNMHEYAQYLLNISGKQAFSLFVPLISVEGIRTRDVTKAEAIEALEKLRDTGKVDWSHCAHYRGTDNGD